MNNSTKYTIPPHIPPIIAFIILDRSSFITNIPAVSLFTNNITTSIKTPAIITLIIFFHNSLSISFSCFILNLLISKNVDTIEDIIVATIIPIYPNGFTNAILNTIFNKIAIIADCVGLFVSCNA